MEGIDEVLSFAATKASARCLPGVRLLLRDRRSTATTTLGREIYDSFTARVGADLYILAHATSPFIRAATLCRCARQSAFGEYDSAFSAEKNPDFRLVRRPSAQLRSRQHPRTQTIEPVYIETSAFFIFRGSCGAAAAAASAIVPTWPSWTASRV